MKKFIVASFILISILVSVIAINFGIVDKTNLQNEYLATDIYFTQEEQISTTETKQEEIKTAASNEKSITGIEAMFIQEEILIAGKIRASQENQLTSSEVVISQEKEQLVKTEVVTPKEKSVAVNKTTLEAGKLMSNEEKLEEATESISFFQKEQDTLKKEFYKDFPVVSSTENMQLQNLDVGIEDNKAVTVEVQLLLSEKISKEIYNEYAEEITEALKMRIANIIGEGFFLKEIGIEASGTISKVTENDNVRNQSFSDKKIYHYN